MRPTHLNNCARCGAHIRATQTDSSNGRVKRQKANTPYAIHVRVEYYKIGFVAVVVDLKVEPFYYAVAPGK